MKIKNFMKLTLTLAFGCFGTNAIAQGDHDHDHQQDHQDHEQEEGGFHFDEYQLVFEGTEAFGDACFLGVVSIDAEENGTFKSAVVETSFSHGEEGPGELAVVQDATNPNMLSFTENDANGKLVRAILIEIANADAGIDLESALRYAVAWSHVGHLDTGVCENLELVYEQGHDEHQDQHPEENEEQDHDHDHHTH